MQRARRPYTLTSTCRAYRMVVHAEADVGLSRGEDMGRIPKLWCQFAFIHCFFLWGRAGGRFL